MLKHSVNVLRKTGRGRASPAILLHRDRLGFSDPGVLVRGQGGAPEVYGLKLLVKSCLLFCLPHLEKQGSSVIGTE